MGLIKYWNKHRKNLSYWDMGLIKFTMIAFTLFVITIWTGAMDWVHSINPWYFFAAFLILGIRPLYRYYLK